MANRQDRRQRQKFGHREYRALMKSAQAELDAGHMREAEIGFKDAAQSAPAESEPHHMLALIAFQAGRFEEAGNHIVEAVLRNDNEETVNVPLHADCGAIMNMLARPAEAEAACRHVIEHNPDHVEAYNNLSVALSMQGRFDDALEICEAAIERRPDYVDALVNRANLLVKMSQYIDAIEAFAEAIKVSPENPMARVNLGTALRLVGELDAAEDQCKFGIELRPDYPEAYSGLANVHAAKGDFNAAIAGFKKALELRPGFDAARLNLAAALFKAGDMDQAEDSYRNLIERAPEAALAQTGLGIVLLAKGELSGATEAFRAAVTSDPGEGEAWMNLASALGAEMPAEDIAKMSELTEDTRLTMEQRTALRFALGEVCDKRGETDAAFAHFRAGNDARKAAFDQLGKIYDPVAVDENFGAIQACFNAEFIGSFPDAGNASEQPVFIVGMPRSGTTLVEQILASHAEVHGAGEVGSVSRLVDNFPDAMRELTAGSISDMADAVLAQLSEKAGGAARIIDKSPFQFQHLGLIRMLFPKARIIHCTRAPLDTGLSCFFQNFVADYPWAADLGHIGRYYNAYARLMEHWRSVLSGIYEVSYEGLIDATEAETRKLVDFAGLKWDDACLSYYDTERPVLTASNWQVRKPIYTDAMKRAGRYEKHLASLADTLN